MINDQLLNATKGGYLRRLIRTGHLTIHGDDIVFSMVLLAVCAPQGSTAPPATEGPPDAH
jgi:hypothetical protein